MRYVLVAVEEGILDPSRSIQVGMRGSIYDERDWDDAKATRILQTCRKAMGPETRLLIVEGVYPPRIDGSRHPELLVPDQAPDAAWPQHRRSAPPSRPAATSSAGRLTERKGAKSIGGEARKGPVMP